MALDITEIFRPISPGDRLFLKRFEIVNFIGSGGFGRVYRAYDTFLLRHVALKTMQEVATDSNLLNQLKHETKRATELTHHHVVRTYDLHHELPPGASPEELGAYTGMWAISMEYIDGQSLNEMLGQRAAQRGAAVACLDIVELTPWVRQLCDALDYAHTTAKIIHRDLKPHNIMIDRRNPDNPIVKLTDLGLALKASITQSQLREVAQISSALSLGYASPQQLNGQSPPPERIKEGSPTLEQDLNLLRKDDIYSLGATLYHLLTGQPPFTGTSQQEVAYKVQHTPPPSLEQRRKDLGLTGHAPITRDWERTILACMEKDPANRPDSIRAVAESLGVIEKTGQLKQAETEALELRGKLEESLQERIALERDVTSLKAQSEELALQLRQAHGVLGSTLDIIRKAPITIALADLFGRRKGVLILFLGTALLAGAALGAMAWVMPERVQSPPPIVATADAPWVNSLGMEFLPLPGAPANAVFLSRKETRWTEFEEFLRSQDKANLAASPIYNLIEGRLGKAGTDWANPGVAVTPETPVVGINWFDAQRFCQWLTDYDRRKGKISAKQYYRLPSFAEFSQAIGLSPDVKLMRLDSLAVTTGEGAPPSANTPDPLAGWPPALVSNFGPHLDRDPDNVTRPAKAPTGFADLAGNVWEWVAESNTLPQNPAGLRGGSWRDENPIALRSDVIWSDVHPYLRLDNVGFRVVLASE